MSALVQGLGDFLKLLVQAFNFSSIFPSAVFVTLCYVYLPKLLPETWAFRPDLIEDAVVRGGVFIMLIALTAYLLDAVNFRLIRFLEGYWFRDQMPFKKWELDNRAHVEWTVDKIRESEELILELLSEARRNRKHRDSLEDLAEALAYQRMFLDRQIAYKYPEEPEAVLPTSLGNVIAAAERYPKKVFGMESIVLWPYLVPILTAQNYAQFIVREKAVLDFLINLNVALTGFGLLCGVTTLLFHGLTSHLLVGLILLGAACWIIYLFALQAAANWGSALRAAFVIFREDLRQSLRLRSAKNYKDERILWRQASEFFQARQSLEAQEALGCAIFDQSTYEQRPMK